MAKLKRHELGVLISIGALIAVALIVGVYIAAQPYGDPDGCDELGTTYTVSENRDGFQPDVVNVKKCDQLKFANDSDSQRTIMFGVHDSMIKYDGVMSKDMQPGESFTIVLREIGDFKFHDAAYSLSGEFHVK